ncbi:MAG: phenylacetate--CoA ligase family protein [Campylobacterales bacterium]
MIEQIDRESSLQRAKEVFKIAKNRSRFYKNKYASVLENDDWENIPFLTRDELYKNTYPRTKDMLTRDLEGVVITSTGGSSGMARYGVLTHKEFDEYCSVQAESLKLIGVSKYDFVANLFVAGNLWPSFFALANVIEKIGATHLPISANIEMEKILGYIMEFRATTLLSLPTVFIFLADLVLKNNLDASFVKTIGYAGEHMSDMIKSHLKKAFKNANIESLGYTSADCGLMGYQCKKCSSLEYHIPSGFQYIEIYNFEENRVCAAGEKGEIVVTNLGRNSLPIIRYRIGDIGRFKKDRCECDDANPILILEGRAGEDFKIGGAYISIDAVESAIEEFVSLDGISANYQFILEDIDENKMKATLQIESSDIKQSSLHTKSIEESLKKEIDELKVGEEMGYLRTEVTFVANGVLERSPITGKIKHFSDLRIGR